MNYNATKRAAIEAAVKTPADPRVSGAILQQQMLSIMGAVDAGAMFLGTATPATIPTTEANCFFLATTPGTYTNFADTGGNPIVLAQGESALIRSVIHLDNLRWQKYTLFAGGGSAQLAVSITYAALKALLDGGNLVPGTWYRITNYVCTTTQANTQAASNAFDILVHADDESHLNENAYAAHHDGDTYFADCKLEAWQLKYCLDNNTTRFGWADGTNGTGVVYWMKDEWDNEAPYDFKNIKFSRTLTNGAYDDHGTAAYVYTFNSYTGGTNSDATVLAATNNKIGCCNNVIYERRNSNSGDYKLLLNNIVFLNVYANNKGYTCSGNTLGFGSFDITIGSSVNNSEIGSNSYSIEIGSNVHDVEIGSSCNTVAIGSNSYSIEIGSNFHDVEIGSGCYNITTGSYVQSVTIGSSCGELNIGSYVQSVTIGSSCGELNIGSNSRFITIGSYCYNFTLYNGVVGVAVTTGTQASPVKNCMVLSGEYGGKTAIEIAFTANLNRTQVATLDANDDVVVYIPGAAS